MALCLNSSTFVTRQPGLLRFSSRHCTTNNKYLVPDVGSGCRCQRNNHNEERTSHNLLHLDFRFERCRSEMPHFLSKMVKVALVLLATSTWWMIDAQPQECPPIDGSCVLQAQYDECVSLVNAGCTDILTLESCPVQFSCQRPLCPPVDGSCVLQEQYDECVDLVTAGCTSISIAESCPVQIGCATPTGPCPPIDGNCVLQEQYDECKALEVSGCSNIAMSKSCPVQFICTSSTNNDTFFTQLIASMRAMINRLFQRIVG